MDDAPRRRSGQSVGNLNRDIQYLIEPHTPARNYLIQRLAPHVFHHDEVVVTLGRNVVDSNNVRVVQHRSGTRLHGESTELPFVAKLFGKQQLKGDKAIKLGIAGLVNDSHSTFTKLLENFVVADVLTCREHWE